MSRSAEARANNNCLFKLGRNCWIISPSTILRLWNDCVGQRTGQVKECDEFSRRCFSVNTLNEANSLMSLMS